MSIRSGFTLGREAAGPRDPALLDEMGTGNATGGADGACGFGGMVSGRQVGHCPSSKRGSENGAKSGDSPSDFRQGQVINLRRFVLFSNGPTGLTNTGAVAGLGIIRGVGDPGVSPGSKRGAGGC